MKFIFFSLLFLFISCEVENDKKEEVSMSEIDFQDDENVEMDLTKDTIFFYTENDHVRHYFDTLLNGSHYIMEFYCLNDSLVFNEVFTGNNNENENRVSIEVTHNYAVVFTIQKDDHKVQSKITKDHFKDSLPDEFLQIASIRKNEFEDIIDNSPIFRATLSQPDSGFQYAVLYSLSEDGAFQLVKVEDESF